MVYHNYKPPVQQVRRVILLTQSDYLKTTNTAPTMQPMNPRDNTNLNLMQVLNNNNENNDVKQVTTSMFSRIWFYLKIVFICLGIFLVLGIGGRRRQKKHEEEGEHKHHWLRYSIIGLLVFWLIDRFFGDDISREVNHLRGDHRQCNHNQGYNQQSNDWSVQGNYQQGNYPPNYQQGNYPPNHGYNNQQGNYPPNQGYNQRGYDNQQGNYPPNQDYNNQQGYDNYTQGRNRDER